MKTNTLLLAVAFLTVGTTLMAQPQARMQAINRTAPRIERVNKQLAANVSPDRLAFAQTERLAKTLNLSDKQSLKVLKLHRSYAARPQDAGLNKAITSVLNGYQKEKYTYMQADNAFRMKDRAQFRNRLGKNRGQQPFFSNANSRNAGQKATIKPGQRQMNRSPRG